MTTAPLPTPPAQPPEGTSRWRRVLAIVVVVLAVIGLAFVLWKVFGDSSEPVTSPSPSETPSPSVTPSETPSPAPSPSVTPSPSVIPASFTDINGRWCDSKPEAMDSPCITFDLPTVASDGDTGSGSPQYVYLADGDPSTDPSTWTYDSEPDVGGCWRASVDVWPGESGAPILFCPAGAVSGQAWIDQGDATVDRIFPGSEDDVAPFLRDGSE